VDSPSHTVLVVDDDPAIRFLCRVNLELDGWTVREAASIPDARAELESLSVSLVLLDVHVGSESGLDFLAEIRERHRGLPVAMLTGSVGTPAFSNSGLDADAVITKPFRPEELSDVVARLTRQASREAG
jgi:DNA-binding response OmpR family regulator